MKRFFLLFVLFCMTGCSNMQTITEEDIENKKINSKENIQETITEISPHTFISTKEVSNSSYSGYLCNDKDEQMFDLYLNPDKDGKIHTKIVYEISIDEMQEVEGLFFVAVDEKIVPSSIENGKETDIHYVSIPTKKNITDISINLEKIDLSYNHMITFYFVDGTEKEPTIFDMSKFIGSDKNKSYSEYIGKIPYVDEASDTFMKEEIKEASILEDEGFISSNLYQMKYQSMFDYGDIFPLSAEESILRRADQEGRELTEEEIEKFLFIGNKGTDLEFEVLYKPLWSGVPTSGSIHVWCNGEWAKFNGEEALFYCQQGNGYIKSKGSIRLPNEPGTYELWYFNLDLNDIKGGEYMPSIKKHIIEVK